MSNYYNLHHFYQSSLKYCLIVFSFMLTQCSDSQNLIKLEINENVSPCDGILPSQCLKYRIVGSDNNSFQMLKTEIIGFNFQEGYRQIIVVEREQDGGYKFIKSIDKKLMPNKN